MKRVAFINNQGDSLEFASAAPFIFVELDMSNSVNLYSDRTPNQDGRSYVDNSIETKEITLRVVIEAKNRKHMIECRSKLNKIMNPKLNQGRLISLDGGQERQIACIVDRLPYFTDVTPVHAECLISLEAFYPYWQSTKDIKIDMVTWLPSLEFIEGEGFWTEQTPNYWIESGEPFEELMSEFGVGDPVEFGYREINQIIEINNTGDVDCPLRVIFRASGAVEKPYIQDMQTRELLRVNKTLNIGDVLEITTEFGNKNVYLNGEKAHHYLDFLNSTWLQLSPGINLIKYDAEHGLTNLECSIYHTPQYLGV